MPPRKRTEKRRGRPPHADVLTPAEWRTVHALQHGMSYRRIAELRRISVDAVKFHVTNAIAKLGLGNRQALRHWFRAPQSTAMSRRKVTMSAAFKLGPVGQIARTVGDIRLSEAWYRDVLGLTHLYTFDKMAFFDMGGTRLYLTQHAEAPAPESILYLLVPDIKLGYETLKARKVEFVGAPHLIHTHPDGTEEWMAFFKDLEGRTLALMSQVKP